ncbi:MAG: hypothetical protein KIT17_12135 [Rubrivivax sp.]|nr:hypothetical protein [Rubrivivax sp.]
MAHAFVLYLHIAAAMLLVGGTVAARLAGSGVRAATDLSALRGALDAVRRATRLNPLLAILVLASGAVLGRSWWSTPWFWVATAAWIGNLAMAVRFVGPGHRALGLAAQRAGSGAVPDGVDALRHRLAPALALDVMIGLDFGTLLLMVLKPSGTVPALLWPALGVLLSCAMRSTRPAARGEPAAAAAPGA